MLSAATLTDAATGDFDFGAARAAMVASQLQPNGVSDPAVVKAFADVRRERFAAPGREKLAYVDAPLPCGGGRSLMAPLSLGYLLQRLALTGARALVVGAGTGYAAAVLAAMGCRVTALEEDAELAARAAELADGYDVQVGAPAAGWPAGAPYDLILAEGRVSRLPEEWAAQLAEGGRVAAIVLGGDGVQRASVAVKAGPRLVFDPFIEAAAPELPGVQAKPVFRF